MNMAANMNLENQMLLHDLKSPVQALCALIESAMDSLDREQIREDGSTPTRSAQNKGPHPTVARHVATGATNT